MNIKKYKAFSLIELSVVILIIGLLSAGVLQGASVIQKARIANARSLTANSPVTHLDGLVAWYETSMLESFNATELSDESPITNWYDINPRSRANKPATRPTTTAANDTNTLYVTANSNVTMYEDGINRLPSIKFHGVRGIHLDNFYQGPTQRNTLFYVISIHDESVAHGLFDSGNSSSNVAFFAINPSHTNTVHMNFGTGVDPSISPLNIQLGEGYIGAVYLNDTSSKGYLNDATNMVSGSLQNPGSNALQGLTIGSSRADSYPTTGLISEIIVYDRILKIHERKKVMKYLSLKYGITVAGDN